MQLYSALILAIVSSALAASDIPESEHGKPRYERVTCGSIIKLTNLDSGHKLHSHNIAYASGSGQQSVTGLSSNVDANSFWKIEASHGRTCERSDPIPCGAAIRLRHVNTKGYLHSHHHNSPISGQQEVSCFDKEDHGDDWQVICIGKSKEWEREDGVKLMHVETKKYLSASTKYSFAAPIPGQLEVACSSKDGSSSVWAAQASLLKVQVI